MTNPGSLVDALVQSYRLIQDLVQELDGDSSRIFAYLGHYPGQSNLARAIYDMPPQSVMVAYQGFQGGQTGGSVWAHRISVFCRLRASVEQDTGTSYFQMLHLLVSGKPANQDLRMVDYEFHPNFDSMVDLPSLARQSLMVDQSGNAIDYYEMSVICREKGEY